MLPGAAAPHFAPSVAVVSSAHVAARRTAIPPSRILRNLRRLATVYAFVRVRLPHLAHALPSPSSVLDALRTADLVADEEDYYPTRTWRRPAFPLTDTTWKPLGDTGQYQLSPQDLADAFDQSRPRPPSKPPPPPAPSSTSPALQLLLADLTSHQWFI